MMRPVAQTDLPKPIRHWDFEGNTPQIDRVEQAPLELSRSTSVEREGEIQYLQVSPQSNSALQLLTFEELRLTTVSMVVRLSPEDYEHQGNILLTPDNSLRFLIHPDRLVFRLRYLDTKGTIAQNRLEIKLDGSNLNSYGYYIDGGWHHIQLGFDLQAGDVWVFVDGRQPEGFSARIPPGQYLVSQKGTPSRRLELSPDFAGQIGDLEIFSKRLSSEQSASLFRELGLRFYLPNSSPTTPRNLDIRSGIDLAEYPLGHPNPDQSALDQLRSFPDPRYKEGHHLLPMYNWVDPAFLGGKGQEGIRSSAVIQNNVDIQSELAARWNYMLVINNSKKARSSARLSECSTELQALVTLANQHPEWPLAVTTLWAQVEPGILEPGRSRPYILDRNLPLDNYATNEDGNPIDARGKVRRNPQAGLTFDPNLAEKDGLVQQVYLQRLLSWLDRPIDMINENGEVPPLPQDSGLLEFDSNLRKQFEAQESDWETFQARQKLALRQAYASAFMGELRGLRDTKFSWYGVDGGPINRFEWQVSREIGSSINGQYYSTPDFYPRWPDNWEKWKGAWRGWAWIEESRMVELAEGDLLFSPFVAAGWSANPEQNIRPSQWLGLLKVLGPLGAEFFYTGFFIESSGGEIARLPKPENYVWQLAMPAYAQAITSYYEDILRDGELINDQDGNPILRHDVGDPRILVTCRKLQHEVIIAATIQPISNHPGNVPDVVSVSTEIEGLPISFDVRRQGSVYRWNQKTGRINQLDEWHGLGHPGHWE